MSATYRSMARLPLKIFEQLSFQSNDDEYEESTAMSIRASVCHKLKQPYKKADPITTVGGFLKQSCMTLVRILDPILTYEECVLLRTRICSYCAPRPASARSLLQSHASRSFFSTGLKSLDHCLKGGFRVGTVSELVGPAGVGKTQLAMQLCVMAAQHGFGTVYLDTEKKLSLARIREIALGRSSSSSEPTEGFFYDGDATPQQEEVHHKNPNQVLSNITVQSPSSTKELLTVMQSIEEEVLLRNDEAISNPNKLPVQLLIVDSIAAPSRREKDAAPQRAALLVQIAQVLKRLADQLNLCVVTINQVGTNNFTSVRAALGETWHHCLSTRVLMQGADNMQRRITVVKSNVAGNTSTNYRIAVQGLVDEATPSVAIQQ